MRVVLHIDSDELDLSLAVRSYTYEGDAGGTLCESGGQACRVYSCYVTYQYVHAKVIGSSTTAGGDGCQGHGARVRSGNGHCQPQGVGRGGAGHRRSASDRRGSAIALAAVVGELVREAIHPRAVA